MSLMIKLIEQDGVIFALKSVIEVQAVEIAALKKDAERYRYFRAFKIMPIDIEVECRKRGIFDITPSLLDEIIDAAMEPK